MQKRRINILLFSFLVLFLMSGFGCSKKEKLLLLNWGEYISEEAVAEFEKEYNCNVIISIADSNELFYSKIKSGTTAYDLVVPSDYMVEKMYDKNLLQKIDLTSPYLTNYHPEDFLPGVKGITENMLSVNSELIGENYTYFVPYLWGTFGLMYNKKVNGLEESVVENGWKSIFEKDGTPTGTRVGMYNAPRFAYAAACFYNGDSPNEQSEEMLEKVKNTLSQRKFQSWGNDTLKKAIANDNLDLAFVYTGDFLDMLYTKLDTIAPEDVSFDIYIPNETIAFMDNLVIPKNARHVDLAYKFINFMCDPEHAYMNASEVGYCTPFSSTYHMITDYTGEDTWEKNWAYAVSKYYPLPAETDEIQYKGTALSYFDNKYLNRIATIINNIKA